MIHRIKHAPEAVLKWFELNFPAPQFTYKFYWYKAGERKIYGCEVYKDGKYWHNATQADVSWYAQLKKLY